MTAGQIMISFDFECGWGVIGNGAWRRREASGVYEALRPAMRRLVGLLEDLEISCTWAVVGAMITAPGARVPDHLRGRYAAQVREFLADAAPETQDARDLLDLLLAARCRQQFATHGYSHVLFDDPEQDATAIAAELDRAVEANHMAGIGATRFVFPQNRGGHYAALRAAGIEVARLWPLDRGAPAAGVRPRALPLRAVRAVCVPPSPVLERVDESGLRLHHASELLSWGETAGALRTAVVKWRLSRALNLAASGQTVHLWLHPFNLVVSPGLAAHVEVFLHRVAAHRERGNIAVGRF